MILYAVLSTAPNPALGERIQVVFGDDMLRINDDQWLVAANTTPTELVTRLGAGEGAYGQVAVFGIEGYFGWHRKDLWDWIALKRRL